MPADAHGLFDFGALAEARPMEKGQRAAGANNRNEKEGAWRRGNGRGIAVKHDSKKSSSCLSILTLRSSMTVADRCMISIWSLKHSFTRGILCRLGTVSLIST